ncbi:MAG TPA: tetratricopeptide repeat protein, partial [Thermogutta sp.]|nr:tetratricopeptide repeat protein [Thermogutta sp.]
MNQFLLQQIRRRHILREAEGYLELGLFERALECLDRLPDRDRQSFEARLIRAEILRAMGQYESALEIYESLIAQRPDDLNILLAMGWCHKRIGRIDLACADLEKAKQISPRNSLVLYNL